jgi:hypothetical protein
VNDEVSVAELLVREGWGDRDGSGQSRWRVLAVMLAVVMGCGAAAVLVAFGGKGTQDASPVDQIQVIPFPQRTTGLGGVDQATDSPSDGGVGGGTGGDIGGAIVPGSDEHRGTVTEVPGTTPDTESSTESTSTSTTTPTDGAPGTGTATTTPPAGQMPPRTTPAPPRPTCILIICW